MTKRKTNNLPKGTKLVPFADYMMDLIETPEMQKWATDMKAFKQQSQAEFERKFSKELMDLCMEINGRHSVIAWCTENIQHSNDDMSKDELDTLWDRRKNETYSVAQLYAQYDQLVAKLDLAVCNEKAKNLL